jgi:hypothetical protein
MKGSGQAGNHPAATGNLAKEGQDMSKALLERRFHEAMLSLYKRAKAECGYNAPRFLQMVNARGGLQAAQSLLQTPGLSERFIALWQKGRLDLTVERLVLDREWKELFSDEAREVARQRLAELGYLPSGHE